MFPGLLGLISLGCLLWTNPVQPGQWIWLRLVLLGLSLSGFTIGFVKGVVKRGGVKRGIKNILTSAFGLVVLFLILEGIFMFVARTNGPGHSLSSALWYHRYWKLNNQGYRGQAWDREAIKGKKIVLALGDSFTAGQGIKDPENCWPGQLQEILGTNFLVYNLGVSGANTWDELQNLKKFQGQPDYLIVGYYLNDIEHAAAEAGITYHPSGNIGHESLLEKIALRSWFLNFLLTSLPPNDDYGYRDFLEKAFSDPEVMATHQKEIAQIVDFAKRNPPDSLDASVKVLFVLFPALRDHEFSAPLLRKIASLADAEGAEVLDLSTTVKKYPINKIIVNRSDDHPGPLLHKEVAKEIALNFLKPTQ